MNKKIHGMNYGFSIFSGVHRAYHSSEAVLLHLR